MSKLPESLKLSDGRVLTLKEIDPGDMLDLIEAAGTAASGPALGAWLSYAQSIASVTAIDGAPVRFPINKDEIKELARRLGSEGVVEIQSLMMGNEEIITGGLSEAEKAIAKN